MKRYTRARKIVGLANHVSIEEWKNRVKGGWGIVARNGTSVGMLCTLLELSEIVRNLSLHCDELSGFRDHEYLILNNWNLGYGLVIHTFRTFFPLF